jgi:hypothetical protein
LGTDTQLAFPGLDVGSDIIKEFMECLQLFNDEKLKDLKERIPSKEYFSNFVTLAQNIAPDGTEVRAVAFSAINQRTQTANHVELHNTRERLMKLSTQINTQSSHDDSNNEPSTAVFNGILKGANGVKSGAVSIVDDGGNEHRISVPIELLDDLVKDHWGQKVIAWTDDTKKKRHRYVLTNMLRDTANT